MGRRKAGEMPAVRVDASKGHARVRIDGHVYWLGHAPGGKPTKEQVAKAATIWAAHCAGHSPQGAAAVANEPVGQPAADNTVARLCVAFLDHADSYYRGRDGEPTSTVLAFHSAAKRLEPWFGAAVDEFGPLALRAVQSNAVTEGKTRDFVNRLTKSIKHVFRWGVSHQLVPAAVHTALATVPALKRGRTDAPETAGVDEVPDADVLATLEHLSRTVGAMVRFQRLTGARPTEVCILRPGAIDQIDANCWEFTPDFHKTEHAGSDRTIAIGPKAYAVIKPFLSREPDAYCFSPTEAAEELAASKRAARKSPMTPSQAARRPKTNGKRQPGDRYTDASYRRAVQRAAVRAGVPKWSPNQLRHNRAGELEEGLGLEVASATLGHRELSTTSIYAKRKQAIAREAARKTG